MKITLKQIKERKEAPTTPFWESVKRRANRVSAALVGLGTALLGLKASFPDVEFIDWIVKVGGIIVLLGTGIGLGVKFASDITVANPEKLKQ